MNRRVVITGVGVVTPVGITRERFWQSMKEGRSGIGQITTFDTDHYANARGGEIRDFKPETFLDGKDTDILDRSTQLLHAAVLDAFDGTDFDPGFEDRFRSGVIVGTTTGADSSNFHSKWNREGFDSILTEDVLRYRSDLIPNYISQRYRLKGPSLLVTNACAAGTYAIGQAMNLIRSGRADFMIAGGTERMSDLAMCGFNATRSLSSDEVRPFDKLRKGLLLGEGAAVLFLETPEAATKRAAKIYGEVAGFGLSCDAAHMTSPMVGGEGAALSMLEAIRDAGLSADDIDYISAHGTGTALNDRMETNAVKRVFGERAYRIPMSSIKSMIGHTLGASGAIEAAACAMILETGIIPPTINYTEKDADCDLYYVPNKAAEARVNTILSNSYAFGGNNASIILRRFENE